MYPTEPILPEATFDAIVNAASVAGDDSLWLRYLEEEYREGTGYWAVSGDDFPGYQSLGWIAVRNALFSPSGRWGILISDDDIAIAGARDEAFIESLSRSIPRSLHDQLTDFSAYYRTYVKEGDPEDRLPALLEHLKDNE